MPKSKQEAVKFLETQWSSINENKIKGIIAETDFRKYLINEGVHFIPGGWILTPGKNSIVEIPARHKICLLPLSASLSWYKKDQNITPAFVSAYNYFRQVGITTYVVKPEDINESLFSIPEKKSAKNKRAIYPKPYELSFHLISPSGDFKEVNLEDVFSCFPKRSGNKGLRCYETKRVDVPASPWCDDETISELFWFEYARYYCQIDYLISNNDLDLFIIGGSGIPYPVEVKSKSPVVDDNIGDWFGLDVGPFAKMAFFTSNNMQTDALYIVQEVDEGRNHVRWLGIKFTELVKSCSWVIQAGGRGMSGSSSSTIKVPKRSFKDLSILLKEI